VFVDGNALAVADTCCGDDDRYARNGHRDGWDGSTVRSAAVYG
jgi:hypothetical protein